MRESVSTAILKRLCALESCKHRTISIISQLGKVLLRVIMNRMRGKINEGVSVEQFIFRKGKCTITAIFALRMIIERSNETQNNCYMCFVGIDKVYDRMKHDEMIKILNDRS